MTGARQDPSVRAPTIGQTNPFEPIRDEIELALDHLAVAGEQDDRQQAAECYRKVIAFIREHPDDYDPDFEDVLVKVVDRLDPSV